MADMLFQFADQFAHLSSGAQWALIGICVYAAVVGAGSITGICFGVRQSFGQFR